MNLVASQDSVVVGILPKTDAEPEKDSRGEDRERGGEAVAEPRTSLRGRDNGPGCSGRQSSEAEAGETHDRNGADDVATGHGVLLMLGWSEFFVRTTEEPYPDTTSDVQIVVGQHPTNGGNDAHTSLVEVGGSTRVFVGLDCDVEAIRIHCEAADFLRVDHDVLDTEVGFGIFLDMQRQDDDFGKSPGQSHHDIVRHSIGLVACDNQWHGVSPC